MIKCNCGYEARIHSQKIYDAMQFCAICDNCGRRTRQVSIFREATEDWMVCSFTGGKYIDYLVEHRNSDQDGYIRRRIITAKNMFDLTKELNYKYPQESVRIIAWEYVDE